MKVDKTSGTMMKKALESRQPGSLPSNFTFRMMEQIRVETVRQEKRKQRIGVLSLASAVGSMIGLLIYVLFFYMDYQISDWMPSFELSASFSLLGFYSYIAILALALLGADYWIRRKKYLKEK